MTWDPKASLHQRVRAHYIPSSSWIFLCISGFVTRYRRLQEMAVVIGSNPGQHGARLGKKEDRNKKAAFTKHPPCM